MTNPRNNFYLVAAGQLLSGLATLLRPQEPRVLLASLRLSQDPATWLEVMESFKRAIEESEEISRFLKQAAARRRRGNGPVEF